MPDYHITSMKMSIYYSITSMCLSILINLLIDIFFDNIISPQTSHQTVQSSGVEKDITHPSKLLFLFFSYIYIYIY